MLLCSRSEYLGGEHFFIASRSLVLYWCGNCVFLCFMLHDSILMVRGSGTGRIARFPSFAQPYSPNDKNPGIGLDSVAVRQCSGDSELKFRAGLSHNSSLDVCMCSLDRSHHAKADSQFSGSTSEAHRFTWWSFSLSVTGLIRFNSRSLWIDLDI
jgi:hypothetical protein